MQNERNLSHYAKGRARNAQFLGYRGITMLTSNLYLD